MFDKILGGYTKTFAPCVKIACLATYCFTQTYTISKLFQKCILLYYIKPYRPLLENHINPLSQHLTKTQYLEVSKGESK